MIGKAGRANTATDPAPLEMFETVINLKPESEWRPGMNIDKLIAELDRRAAIPRHRQLLDHADQGAHRHAVHRHPHAGRHQGVRQGSRRRWSGWRSEIEAVVKQVPGTSSAYAERITGGYYLDIEPDRAALARYGINPGELQDVVATAIGGEMVTTTVEGRERFGVTVRYPRELRDSPDQIARQVLVPAMAEMNGAQAMIPLGQVAKVRIVQGRAGDPHRERAALGLHLRRHPRARHRLLRRRGAEGGGRAGEVPARLLRDLERPVRVHGARDRTA